MKEVEMTQAIDANGQVATPETNLVDNNEIGFSYRDTTGEDIANGHLKRVSTYIEDSQANNNAKVVTRDGSRQWVNGDYHPDDVLMIDGIEVTYEVAASLGLIEGGTLTSPQEDFAQDAENTEAPTEEILQGADLLSAQLDVATNGNGEDALNVFASDVVTNGEISEAGIEFAAKQLGFTEQMVQEQYAEMQEVGGQNLLSALEVGDGLGSDRVDFLIDRHENGTPQEQRLVRQIWAGAALNKLSTTELQGYFDQLYQPFDL